VWRLRPRAGAYRGRVLLQDHREVQRLERRAVQDSRNRQAELAKHHIDVLWSDYFKPEHVQKYPEITELCWKAAKQCSKVKGSLDLGEARTLLDMIDKIADVWTKAGGPQATRVQKAVAARA